LRPAGSRAAALGRRRESGLYSQGWRPAQPPI
jgi:hypothetical protein